MMKVFLLSVLCTSTLQAACIVPVETTGTPSYPEAPDNPLIQIANMRYEGAFLLNSGEFGSSTVHEAEGGMAYAPPKSSAPNGSVFVTGNTARGGVSEWAIPEIVKSTNVNDLNMTDQPLQPFADIKERAPERRVGMGYFSDLLWLDDQLLYSEHRYYPASNLDVHKLGVLRVPSDLQNSPAAGYFQVNTVSGEEGGNSYTASESSGWMSKIPDEWQSALGGSHLLGPADGWSVEGRFAAGPSVFAFNPEADVLNKNPEAVIGSVPLVDYSTESPINLIGEAGEGYVNAGSDLWNSMSFVHFGFIPPGSRTLMLVGNQWGIDGDIGYKITQDNGNLCGGPCAFKQADASNYYWLIDLNDVLEAINGQRRHDSIMPYAYGPLPLPFQQDKNGNPAMKDLRGGAFDPDTGTVYFQIRGGDPRPLYELRPAMVAYDFDTSIQYLPPVKPSWLQVAGTAPSSTTAPEFEVSCGSCGTEQVSVSWQIPAVDTAGNSIVVDHFRLQFENVDLPYSNKKRNQRVGVTVAGTATQHVQDLSPGNWRVTIRAVSGDGVPSQL